MITPALTATLLPHYPTPKNGLSIQPQNDIMASLNHNYGKMTPNGRSRPEDMAMSHQAKDGEKSNTKLKTTSAKIQLLSPPTSKITSYKKE